MSFRFRFFGLSQKLSAFTFVIVSTACRWFDMAEKIAQIHSNAQKITAVARRRSSTWRRRCHAQQHQYGQNWTRVFHFHTKLNKILDTDFQSFTNKDLHSKFSSEIDWENFLRFSTANTLEARAPNATSNRIFPTDKVALTKTRERASVLYLTKV